MGEPKIHRILLVFNGSTSEIDGVAKKNAGITQKLVNTYLQNGADHVFVLMRAENIWPNDPRVTVAYPSAETLRAAVEQINKTNPDENTDIYFSLMGHGGGDDETHFLGDTMSAETFVNIASRLRGKAQVTYTLDQCHAASFVFYKDRLIDDNDLLMSYSGRKSVEPVVPMPKKEEEDEKAAESELNWLDGRDLGLVNGDPMSHRRMFWLGKYYSANTDLLNRQRGFVFLRGEKYIDRGITGDGKSDDYGTKVIEVTADIMGPAVAQLNDILIDGYKEGITILCYDLAAEPARTQIRKQLDALQKKYKGIAQFVWIDRQTSLEFLKMTRDTNFQQEVPFSFRFYEANEDKIFRGVSSMEKELQRVLAGFSMAAK